MKKKKTSFENMFDRQVSKTKLRKHITHSYCRWAFLELKISFGTLKHRLKCNEFNEQYK